LAVAGAVRSAYEEGMEQPATNDPLAPLKAQLNAAFQLLIKPHTMPFHVAAAALAGLITVGFLVLTLLVIMVATNFNVLNWIE
jgi:hypothetical protein